MSPSSSPLDLLPSPSLVPTLSKAEINVKAREMLAKGIDRAVVTAFIKKKLAELEASQLASPTSSRTSICLSF